MRFSKGLLPFLVVLSCVGAHAATYVVPKDEFLIGQSDAIVIARALHSHVEESAQRGIETVTVFAVEEVLKGDPSLANGIRVRALGGMVETKKGQLKVKVVPGAPRFIDGDRVLLLVRKVGADDFATTDLGLGWFAFATDDVGNRVLTRDDAEIVGWNPDGSVHHEPRRDADRFVGFIRDVVNHRAAAENYIIKANPLAGDSRLITKTSLKPRPLAVGNVTQYTLPSSNEASQGQRWNTFPSAVNFNRGNAAINVGNSGSDAINTAFASWNGDTSSNVNYVLASTIANPNGIEVAPDTVNNIVFEKDLNSIGAPAFVCGAPGGILGVGGLQTAVSDVTNIVSGETFFATTEVDVSMNQGVGNCLPGGGGSPTFAIADYNSGMTHEVGHTLGFRHSNKTRDNSASCTTMVTYDCEQTTAIMMSTIPNGLAAALRPWDQRAVAALYPGVPPPPAPTNVVATAATGTSVDLTWTASTGATSYTVLRTADNSTYSTVGTPGTNSLTDSTASAGTAYFYKVTATGPGGTSADSNKDLATTVIFANDPLVTGPSGTTVQALHVTQLRTAVTAVCTLASNPAPCSTSFTDPSLTLNVTQVKRLHVTELRAKLDAARTALGLSVPVEITDPTITQNTTLVKGAHLTELRNGVK